MRGNKMKMKKLLVALIALALTPSVSFAAPKAEVLHWWTGGGEAKALKVLQDDFAAQGGIWLDMPVSGGGGDAAMQTLKARIVANDAPAAAQIKHSEYELELLNQLTVFSFSFFSLSLVNKKLIGLFNF